jgi:hypothetical protein
MSAYWPPLENLPTFDVLVFRNAQDVVEYAVESGIANDIAGGVAGDLLYQSAPSTTAKLPIGANTYILSSNGSIPTWTAPPVIPGTPTLSAVLVAGNSAGATSINMNNNAVSAVSTLAVNSTSTFLDTLSINIAALGVAKVGFNITDTTLNNTIRFIPSLTNGILSPFASVGSSAIAVLNGTIGNQTLEIYPWSNNTVGIRLSGTSALIGAGGTTSFFPTSSISFAGTSATMTGNLNMGTGSITNATAMTATTFNGTLNGNATTATNISLGTAGDLLYQSASNVTAKLAIGANTYVLTSNGSAPVWTAPGAASTPSLSAVLLAGNSAGATNIDMNTQSITNATAMTATTFNGALNGTASLATNISLGTAGDLLYQSASNVTAKLAIGANTYFLTSNGTAPVWTAPTTPTISTTQTALTPYYLVGSSSQGTSSDTTLYKSSNGQGVYVNPATNDVIMGGVIMLNTNTDSFYISYFTPSSDDVIMFNNCFTAAVANNTFFYNLDSGGNQRTVLTLNGDPGASTFDGLAAASTTVAVADDNTGGTFFPIFASTGAGQKSLLFDTTTTPLSYVPSTSTLSASNFSGLASQSTTVAVADDNSTTTMYPVFTTATAGQKSLLFDSTTTPLRYKPSTGVMSSVQFAVGAFVEPVAGDNAGLISQNTGSSATIIQNQATSGLIRLATRDAANALTIPLQISFSNCNISTTNDPVISARNIIVDNSSTRPITIGNGSSTSTSNIIITTDSLVSTRVFTAGGNVVIGPVAGNSLPVGATDNTFIGDVAGGTTTGSSNICIGYNSQVPTVANSNQIAIGTVAETMYIQGGFNLRVGTAIVATINLSAVVLAQFYAVSMGVAAQTITLPTPSVPAYRGAMVTFKRKVNTTAFTLAAGAGTPFIPIGAVAAAATIAVGAAVFQVTLVCDGVNWCSISQA